MLSVSVMRCRLISGAETAYLQAGSTEALPENTPVRHPAVNYRPPSVRQAAVRCVHRGEAVEVWGEGDPKPTARLPLDRAALTTDGPSLPRKRL
ncbi:hypothetical protein AAFF_G00073130 [Aldrovandia affinis]|uniref:Uncharacterized protein n=1 Tax=Aldrovandia affinis TaxID=143900 RepID=A0AAD7WE59_9TELE|nr:hypothetical protein AAFF_G00073130 [Aldrovandia affinis]